MEGLVLELDSRHGGNTPQKGGIVDGEDGFLPIPRGVDGWAARWVDFPQGLSCGAGIRNVGRPS